MADEPKKLRSIKELLSLFKPGGLEKLLLRMKSKKQGFEIEGQLGKINAATMLEEYNPEIGGYENTTDTMFDVLDSLKTEKAETDSLLQILEQDVFEGSNVETESDIDLDSSEDKEMFKKWGLYNLKLLLDSYEEELNPGLETPNIQDPT